MKGSSRMAHDASEHMVRQSKMRVNTWCARACSKLKGIANVTNIAPLPHNYPHLEPGEYLPDGVDAFHHLLLHLQHHFFAFGVVFRGLGGVAACGSAAGGAAGSSTTTATPRPCHLA